MKKLLLILLVSVSTCQLSFSSVDEPTVNVTEQKEAEFNEFYDELDAGSDEYIQKAQTEGEYEMQDLNIPPFLKSFGISMLLGFYDLQEYCLNKGQQFKSGLAALYAALVDYGTK